MASIVYLQRQKIQCCRLIPAGHKRIWTEMNKIKAHPMFRCGGVFEFEEQSLHRETKTSDHQNQADYPRRL